MPAEEYEEVNPESIFPRWKKDKKIIKQYITIKCLSPQEREPISALEAAQFIYQDKVQIYGRYMLELIAQAFKELKYSVFLSGEISQGTFDRRIKTRKWKRGRELYLSDKPLSELALILLRVPRAQTTFLPSYFFEEEFEEDK